MERKDLSILRHSAAHLLAHAVTELYPTALLTIGPATEEGFFYDFKTETPFKEEDLPVIQARMDEIVKRNLPLTHEMMPKAEARKLYANNPFKLELIDGIDSNEVGIARQGEFYDLCRGGHVARTGELANTKLLFNSGSYWRGDKKNAALQRITGTAFYTKQELEDFIQMREDALKYDHRKMGKQLDLFSFHDEGPGFPFFHAKGKTIVNTMVGYVRSLLEEAGYQEIQTPTMLTDDLWKQSGHYAHYKKNMYFCEIDDRSYAIKPMNCPGSILIYKERPRSYRELPLRLAEFGHVHRFELSGVLHGLMRARAFTIDDAHLYCMPEQIEQEVLTTIAMTYKVLKRFGFDNINVGLSTKPENAIGSDELWKTATDALSNALTKAGIPFVINEGDGAFYGPKIEFGIQDSLKRTWQCGTVQVDFFMPENFDLEYVASSGQKERPVIVHRAIYGSIERFLAILIEHTKGNLPFWIAPVQATILTITDDQKPYAETVAAALKRVGVRVIIDQSSDPLSGKIKVAQQEKTPWMIVVGKKEAEAGTVTLRHRDGSQEHGLTVAKLVEKAQELIHT